jgi:hypothetical protein
MIMKPPAGARNAWGEEARLGLERSETGSAARRGARGTGSGSGWGVLRGEYSLGVAGGGSVFLRRTYSACWRASLGRVINPPALERSWQ